MAGNLADAQSMIDNVHCQPCIRSANVSSGTMKPTAWPETCAEYWWYVIANYLRIINIYWYHLGASWASRTSLDPIPLWLAAPEQSAVSGNFMDMEVRWTSKGSSARFVQYVFSRFLVGLLPNSQGPTWDPHNFWTLLAKDCHVGGWIFDSAPGPKQSRIHMTSTTKRP